MMHCWASFNEVMDDVLGEPDKLCMLEDGHDGEHEWTPTNEIYITFS